jgi:GMP synthase (glutamine-hydrolysing)
MKVLCLTHVDFEGPARIGDWARERGHRLDIVRADNQQQAVPVGDYGALIVMGGPMSVNDTYPWLVRELKLIEAAVRNNLRVLGICLGAQLIAKMYGARVYAGAHKEIGWWPVHAKKAPDEGCLNLPGSFVPFHWHGETFDLPTGAEHLASSSAALHQAFLVGEQALGLQFHVEATPNSVRDITRACASELSDSPWVQTSSKILAELDAKCAALKEPCYSLLDRFFAAPEA